jgi:hypothetical protein
MDQPGRTDPEPGRQRCVRCRSIWVDEQGAGTTNELEVARVDGLALGMAASAWAETGAARLDWRVVEAHVGPMRAASGAARPAEDAGRSDAEDEAPVRARVAGYDPRPTGVGVKRRGRAGGIRPRNGSWSRLRDELPERFGGGE